MKFNPNLAIVSFVIVGIVLGGVTSISTASNLIQTLTSQNTNQLASSNSCATGFLVYTDGSYYYAKNCLIDSIEFGSVLNNGGAIGKNLTQVMQATLNQIPSGGYLVVDAGTYLVNNNITVIKPLTLKIEGNWTVNQDDISGLVINISRSNEMARMQFSADSLTCNPGNDRNGIVIINGYQGSYDWSNISGCNKSIDFSNAMGSDAASNDNSFSGTINNCKYAFYWESAGGGSETEREGESFFGQIFGCGHGFYETSGNRFGGSKAIYGTIDDKNGTPGYNIEDYSANNLPDAVYGKFMQWDRVLSATFVYDYVPSVAGLSSYGPAGETFVFANGLWSLETTGIVPATSYSASEVQITTASAANSSEQISTVSSLVGGGDTLEFMTHPSLSSIVGPVVRIGLQISPITSFVNDQTVNGVELKFNSSGWFALCGNGTTVQQKLTTLGRTIIDPGMITFYFTTDSITSGIVIYSGADAIANFTSGLPLTTSVGLYYSIESTSSSATLSVLQSPVLYRLW